MVREAPNDPTRGSIARRPPTAPCRCQHVRPLAAPKPYPNHVLGTATSLSSSRWVVLASMTIHRLPLRAIFCYSQRTDCCSLDVCTCPRHHRSSVAVVPDQKFSAYIIRAYVGCRCTVLYHIGAGDDPCTFKIHSLRQNPLSMMSAAPKVCSRQIQPIYSPSTAHLQPTNTTNGAYDIHRTACYIIYSRQNNTTGACAMYERPISCRVLGRLVTIRVRLATELLHKWAAGL